MKTLENDELYEHLSGFLKVKGIELKEGTYAQAIQKSCGLLTDAINLSQKGLKRAKVEVDKKVDQMRQVIHEKTAPKPPRYPAPPPPAPTEPPPKTSETKNAAPRAARKSAKSKRAKPPGKRA